MLPARAGHTCPTLFVGCRPKGLRASPCELASAASLAKAYCSEAYFHNAGTALQLYGGVGFTWEYDVHLYFKRARASESFLGDGAEHRERIAVELGL